MLTVPDKARQSALVISLVAAACVLGILNSGGYRYGVSDQAFYLPAVLQHQDESLFPRDRALLHAQDRFMLFDDMIAEALRATHLPLPSPPLWRSGDSGIGRGGQPRRWFLS